ncbi:MAG: V-type ATP synthase subunit D [Solirubrobacteraceae bacterium]
MALRIPPGRAGRTWLVGRLETARRGAELLDRKRQALLREQARVSNEADAARRAWREAAARAEMWSARAALLDGAGRLEVLARHVDHPATLTVGWSNLMGARVPSLDTIVIPAPWPVSALGGSSAAVIAARACGDATQAAARWAVSEHAELELSFELGRTARRLRGLRDRLIPELEAALADLNLVLDENQREQAARVRWLMRRQGPSPSSASSRP